jgi:hypothetical protein
MREIKIWIRGTCEVLLISGTSSLKATITEFRVTGNESMGTLKTTSNVVNSS